MKKIISVCRHASCINFYMAIRTQIARIIFLLFLGESQSLLASNAVQCRKLLNLTSESNTPKALLTNQSFAEINWKHWQPRFEQIRIKSEHDSTKYDLLMNGEYVTPVTGGLHVSRVQYVQTVGKVWNGRSEVFDQLSKFGTRNFKVFAETAVKYVLENYQVRRNWSDLFRNKLKNIATDWLRSSTYITSESVFSKSNETPTSSEKSNSTNVEKIIEGTIRLIHEQKGILPLEDYLKIQLKVTPSSIKVEPGNFAILREGNELCIVEFAMQILAQIKRYRAEFGKEPIFITYADVYSKLLYGKMGFKPFNENQQIPLLQPLDNQELRSIQKDGVDWTLMYATEDMLIEILNNKISKAVNKWEQQYPDKFQTNLKFAVNKAINKTVDSPLKPSESYLGIDKRNYARLNISRNNEGVYLTHSLNNELEYNFPVRVPNVLYEGYKKTEANGVEVVYKNGVLHVKSPQSHWIKTDSDDVQVQSFFHEYFLVIDPELKNPTSLEYVVQQGAEPGIRLHFVF